jgi:tetratricopeptide (TPR) repeat protein
MNRWVLPWRVAAQTRKGARKERIPVPDYAPLRKYLADGQPLEAFRTGSPELYETVREKLVDLTARSGRELEQQDSERLVGVLLSAYTHLLPGGQATEVQVHNALLELSASQEHREQSRFAGSVTFEQSLNAIPPQRAAEARELVSSWPEIVRLVHELVSSDDPVVALSSWSQTRPSWFGSPPSVALTWYARLALDYNLNDVALAAIDEAIALGASPATTWHARHAIIQSNENVALRMDALTPFASDYPLARAIVLSDTGETEAAVAVLRDWSPWDAMDKDLKAILLCQLSAANGLDEGLRIAQEAASTLGSVDCALLAADFLLERGSARQSPMDFADLEQSYRTAISLRDSIRLWRGPSHGAVKRAMSAALAMGNLQEAWLLSQTPPDGQATLKEAESKTIRGEAALVAIHLNKRGDAERLLASVDDERIQNEAAALFAYADGDSASELAHWRSAAAHATHPQDLIRACQALAFHGERSAEWPRLAESHPELAEEIGLIADAYANNSDALATLKTRARTSRLCAGALIEWYRGQGQLLSGGQLAERSGDAWADANLFLRAAQIYLDIPDYAAANTAARKALRVAGSAWSKRMEAYDVIVRALTTDQIWDKAAEAAAEVLALDPTNESAAWALTISQWFMGELDAAWRTYNDIAGRPEPRIEAEAVIRTRLWHKFERGPESLSILFDLIDKWPDSKEVRTAAAIALIQFPADEDDEVTLTKVRERLNSLIAGLDEVFVRKEVDPNDVMATLNEMVADLPDTSEVDAKISDGRLPLGYGAWIHGKNYAEILCSYTDSAFFDGDPATFEAEVAVASQLAAKSVVIDITSLLAVINLDTSVADQLLGVVDDLRGVRGQRLDTVVAVENLARLSTMTVGRSVEGVPQVSTISDEEAVRRRERAESLHASFEKVSLHADTTNEEGQRFPAWLAAYELAKSQSCVFWCDDRLIRGLAANQGVSTFGTQALIEGLRRNGLMSDSLAKLSRAVLVANHYVGGNFDAKLMYDAAQLSNWKPSGAADAISYGPPSETPDAVVNFSVHAISQNLDDPDAIAGWTFAISKWLIRIAGTEPAGQRNLTVLILKVLQQQWLNSSRLPFVLRGMRNAIATTGVADPFEPAMTTYYQSLIRSVDHPTALAHVRGLVSSAEASDRVTVTKIALLAPGGP